MEDINKKIDDILEIVNFLKDNSVSKTEFYEFKEEMTEFKEEMTEFKEEMVGFKEEMTEFKEEMVGFKEETKNEFQMIHKEIADFKEETRSEFQKVREEIIDHVDAFVGLHQHSEIELSAVAHKTDRLENNIHQIARHLQLQLD